MYRVELEHMDPVYHSMIAMETVPFIQDLLFEIEITDNLTGFILTETQLIIAQGEKSC